MRHLLTIHPSVCRQPVRSNVKASLRVSLPEPFVPVTGLKFDWAQSPPVSYTVTFSNSSDGSDAVEVDSNNDVQVSNPYVAAKAADIVPYTSNTTNVTLDSPVYSGRFATLTITGNRALSGKKGVGASVAEFAIVASTGDDLARRSSEAWEA